MGSPLGPARAARESAPMLACCARRSPDDDVSATGWPGERRPIAPHAAALAHPHQTLSPCHSTAARVTRGPPDRCRLGHALGRCAAWRQAAAATVAGPAARLHGTNGPAVSAGTGGGPLRNRPSRRATAEEPALAPHWHPLLPLQRAAALGARVADRRARRWWVARCHPPALSRSYRGTRRRDHGARRCARSMLLPPAALPAATRRPRPQPVPLLFAVGPHGTLVASIFKSRLVLVHAGVSAS